MEITKVVKPFIRRGANTFGNIVYFNLIVTKVHPLKRYRPSDFFCTSECITGQRWYWDTLFWLVLCVRCACLCKPPFPAAHVSF